MSTASIRTPSEESYVEIGGGENVPRVRAPADVCEAGGAFVYLALPLGILDGEHLDDVSFVEAAQNELRVGRPLQQTNEQTNRFCKLLKPRDLVLRLEHTSM